MAILCVVPLAWVEFTADIIEHRVREMTSGMRFTVMFFTPGRLERLTEKNWMIFESLGFPVHLYSEKNLGNSCGMKANAASTPGLAHCFTGGD